jgi:hypothetical protein
VADVQGVCSERFGAVRQALLDQDLGDYRAFGIVIAAYEGLDQPG